MPPVTAPSGHGRHGSHTVLGGRYSLTRRIATGGMGQVWAATDTVLGREVAVKILRDDLADSPAVLERFRAEARHTAMLAHPGIAGVYDYGEDRDGDEHVAYLVMELVPGKPLSRLMHEAGPLPVGTTLSLLARTAEALHAAHAAGVVHRDVKPGNVLVLDDGAIKVTDFGIARATNSAALTEVGQVIGTAGYISPEQASGSEASAASDIYSLGVIGYEMLAGHPPFSAENPAALANAHLTSTPPPLPDTVPAPVRDVISAAMSKDPADRPPSALDFATTLRRLQMMSLPPPDGRNGEDPVELGEPTIIIDDGTGSPTAMMPAELVVARSPELGLTGQAYESRRQRRWIAAIAAAVIAVVVLVVVAGSGSPLPVDELPAPTSTPSPTTVATAGGVATATSKPPVTTTTSAAAPTGAARKGKGHKPKG